MITSKPKAGTLFSLGTFLTITFGAFFFGLYSITQTTNTFWWSVLIFSSGPIGVIMLIKVLTGIKIVTITKKKFDIKYPFRLKNVKFNGEDIDTWEHESIKTYGGQYEEIIWKLKSGKKVTLSKQENTEFDKALKYMKSKFAKTKG